MSIHFAFYYREEKYSAIYDSEPVVPEVDVIRIIPLIRKRKDIFEQIGIIVQTIVGVTWFLTCDIKVWKLFSLTLVLDYRNMIETQLPIFYKQ